MTFKQNHVLANQYKMVFDFLKLPQQYYSIKTSWTSKLTGRPKPSLASIGHQLSYLTKLLLQWPFKFARKVHHQHVEFDILLLFQFPESYFYMKFTKNNHKKHIIPKIIGQKPKNRTTNKMGNKQWKTHHNQQNPIFR